MLDQDKILNTVLRQFILVELLEDSMLIGTLSKRLDNYNREYLYVELNVLIKSGAVYKSPAGLFAITEKGAKKIKEHISTLVEKVHKVNFVEM